MDAISMAASRISNISLRHCREPTTERDDRRFLDDVVKNDGRLSVDDAGEDMYRELEERLRLLQFMVVFLCCCCGGGTGGGGFCSCVFYPFLFRSIEK
jgi:hypothetical protein